MNILMHRLVELNHYTIDQLAEMVEAWEHPRQIPSVKPTANAMKAIANCLDKKTKDEDSRIRYLEDYRLESPHLIREAKARADKDWEHFEALREIYLDMHDDIRFVPELLVNESIKTQLGKETKK